MTTRAPIAIAALALLLAACGSNEADNAAASNQSVTATPSAPPPGKSWADVVTETGDGIRMGNPNARVALIEIAALGCPFCKRFAEEGGPAIREMVRRGDVSLEFRPFAVHGAVDVAAHLLARCNGAGGFFPMADAMFRDQDRWMGAVQAAPRADLERIAALPATQAFAETARLAGLPALAARNGLPEAKANACLTSQQMIEREVTTMANVQSQFPDFKGTPAFAINGQLLPDVSNWTDLKPRLDAALK